MTPCLTEKPPKGSFFALLSSHNVVILEMILINQPREKHLEMTFEIKASSRLPKGHIGNQRDKLPREKHLKIIFFSPKKSRQIVRWFDTRMFSWLGTSKIVQDMLAIKGLTRDDIKEVPVGSFDKGHYKDPYLDVPGS